MKKMLKNILLLITLLLIGKNSVLAVEQGKITITSTEKGKTYNLYEILQLESYNNEKKAYVYKPTTSWKNFIETNNTYFQIDETGYVTWVKNADVKELAKEAIEYAEKNNISPTKTQQAQNNTLEFNKLDLGYYLIESSMGTLCELTTTHPNANIKEKNTPPTIKKEVKEDGTGKYEKSNTAQINDTIEYKTTIYAKKGAENYVLTDTMTEGLTLNQNSIVVKVKDTTLTKDTHYTVTSQEHSFIITFKNDYLKTITTDTEITVTYTAKLNEKAILGKVANNGNDNKTILSYGKNHETNYDETRTYTFCFDLVKTDKSNIVLNGAEFELLDKNKNKINLIKTQNNTYRIALENETPEKISAGNVTIQGLDTDTYYLRETKAPEGFTKLATDVTVEIKNDNNKATVIPHEDEINYVYVEGGVKVINTTGDLMPETGSFGTFMFILIGTISTIVCGILLITKFRMSKISI